MQTTATRTAGSHTDLLTGILNVQVRNEDKITEQAVLPAPAGPALQDA